MYLDFTLDFVTLEVGLEVGLVVLVAEFELEVGKSEVASTEVE